MIDNETIRNTKYIVTSVLTLGIGFLLYSGFTRNFHRSDLGKLHPYNQCLIITAIESRRNGYYPTIEELKPACQELIRVNPKYPHGKKHYKYNENKNKEGNQSEKAMQNS